VPFKPLSSSPTLRFVRKSVLLHTITPSHRYRSLVSTPGPFNGLTPDLLVPKLQLEFESGYNHGTALRAQSAQTYLAHRRDLDLMTPAARQPRQRRHKASPLPVASSERPMKLKLLTVRLVANSVPYPPLSQPECTHLSPFRSPCLSPLLSRFPPTASSLGIAIT
jgi:hypothetical protein